MTRLTRRFSAVFAALLFAVLACSTPAFAWGHHRRAARPKRYILVFRPGTSSEEEASEVQALGLREVEEFRFLNMVVAEPAPGQQQEASVEDLRQQSGVEDAEEDFYINWIKSDEPSLSDAFGTAESFAHAYSSSRQSALSAPQPAAAGQPNVPWGIARVGAPSVWNPSEPASMGAGVKVAVVDTGIDCSHPDLQCDASQGYNALDEGAAPDDDNGHGTHVAGTIAGKGKDSGDGTLVYGVAPMATLIPVKVLDQSGGGALSDVVRGINWAAENGADVISMSLGSPKGSRTLQHAVEAAYERGVTVIAAAGNAGPGNDTVGYPGAYPQVIAVAASDKNDSIASFSSSGPQVAFTAPGVDVLSTWPGGKYKVLSGTSMATPHISGLAALAIAAGAHGPDAVRQALTSAAKRLCTPSICPSAQLQGAGIVNAGGLESGGGAQFAAASFSGSGARGL